MANPIEYTNISPNKFVLPTSRYADSQVIRYSENKKITFEIYKKGSYPVNPNDRYMVISKGIEYRPDLLSKRLYGTTDFWWKILEANGIKDIYDFTAGKNIRLPANIF